MANRLARRGVRRIRLLSDDMALRLALRPLSPLPCLKGTKSSSEDNINRRTSLFLLFWVFRI